MQHLEGQALAPSDEIPVCKQTIHHSRSGHQLGKSGHRALPGLAFRVFDPCAVVGMRHYLGPGFMLDQGCRADMVGMRVRQKKDVDVGQGFIQCFQGNRDILFRTGDAGVNQAKPFRIDRVCIN